MFEELREGLKKAVTRLFEKESLDEKAIKEFIREIQRTLIKADVNVKLVFELTKKIEERIKEEGKVPGVPLRELAIKILYEELAGILGEESKIKPDPKKSFIILLVGIQGSGKTTTLYAILEKLNQPGVKIITIEDPVEYKIPGIVQTQVDAKRGFDFANALKYTLRQDPDIIMVGEIRDVETAHTALTAALTGHLVLSTLHTNNAPAALNRLIDMGVKPYLLPGAIRLIIAQRLVRKICDRCKEQYIPDEETWQRIKPVIEKLKKRFPEKYQSIPKKLWRGKGCDVCNGTGFKGRLPIAEFLRPSAKIEKLVVNKGTITEVYEQAIKDGMITMQEDGIRAVLEGKTTPQEVWRVTAD